MYTLKVSYGYVDKPETATVETLGTYETWDDAAEVAQDKFYTIVGDLGEIEGSEYDYYVTYGNYDVEFGRVFSGYDHYCKVSIIKR